MYSTTANQQGLETSLHLAEICLKSVPDDDNDSGRTFPSTIYSLLTLHIVHAQVLTDIRTYSTYVRVCINMYIYT